MFVLTLDPSFKVPETYGVFLLRQKANKLTLETGKNHLSEYDLFDDAKETMSHKLLMSTKRPFQLFFGSAQSSTGFVCSRVDQEV